MKLHPLFNLETGNAETFEATPRTEHEFRHLEVLLTNIEDIERFVADDNTYGAAGDNMATR